MIARFLVAVLFAVAATVCQAFDMRLANGLDVSVDRMAEPVSVDGVSMQLRRVTGKDVPVLLRRIEESWRSQGSEVRSGQQGAWTLLSRVRGPRLEVLEWSHSQGATQMLWSELDPGATRSIPETGLTLPASCKWGRSVSGKAGQRGYVQRSARCAHSISDLLAQLQHMVIQQGWIVRSTSDHGLMLDRRGDEGLISLSQPVGDSATWLVWLCVKAAG